MRKLLLFTLLCTLPLALTAGTPDRGTVYLSVLSGALYRVDYDYDGNNPPTLSPPSLVGSVPRGGGIRYRSGGSLLVIGAGQVSRFDLPTRTVATVSSGNNANTGAFDPGSPRLWVGWKDTPLAEVPLNPLAAGTPRPTTGDDGLITTLAFTPAHGVFYTNGGEAELGNFGRINLSTFVTTRIAAQQPATAVEFDPFSGHLLVAGLGRVSQHDPQTPAAVLSARDDAGGGENYLALTPNARGHLVGTRFGSVARLVFIDYSTSALIGDPSTRFFSLPLVGVSDLSGQAAFDVDAVFSDGFE